MTARPASRAFIPGSQADFPRVVARNQREAGIDQRQWESREQPLRSWLQEIARAAGMIILAGSIWFLAWASTL